MADPISDEAVEVWIASNCGKTARIPADCECDCAVDDWSLYVPASLLTTERERVEELREADAKRHDTAWRTMKLDRDAARARVRELEAERLTPGEAECAFGLLNVTPEGTMSEAWEGARAKLRSLAAQRSSETTGGETSV